MPCQHSPSIKTYVCECVYCKIIDNWQLKTKFVPFQCYLNNNHQFSFIGIWELVKLMWNACTCNNLATFTPYLRIYLPVNICDPFHSVTLTSLWGLFPVKYCMLSWLLHNPEKRKKIHMYYVIQKWMYWCTVKLIPLFIKIKLLCYIKATHEVL